MNQMNNVSQVQQINRGDIYLANLPGGIGSEQSSMRPVVVLQNNMGNKYSPTISVIPLTSRISKKYQPTHVTLHNTKCLSTLSIALAEQVTTISKERLSRYIGIVNHADLLECEQALMVQLGIRNVNRVQYA